MAWHVNKRVCNLPTCREYTVQVGEPWLCSEVIWLHTYLCLWTLVHISNRACTKSLTETISSGLEETWSIENHEMTLSMCVWHISPIYMRAHLILVQSRIKSLSLVHDLDWLQVSFESWMYVEQTARPVITQFISHMHYIAIPSCNS